MGETRALAEKTAQRSFRLSIIPDKLIGETTVEDCLSECAQNVLFPCGSTTQLNDPGRLIHQPKPMGGL